MVFHGIIKISLVFSSIFLGNQLNSFGVPLKIWNFRGAISFFMGKTASSVFFDDQLNIHSLDEIHDATINVHNSIGYLYYCVYSYRLCNKFG